MPIYLTSLISIGNLARSHGIPTLYKIFSVTNLIFLLNTNWKPQCNVTNIILSFYVNFLGDHRFTVLQLVS